MQESVPAVIGFQQRKGGVGKSTLTLNVAACLALQRKRVLVVDADPQGSCMTWDTVRSVEPLFSVVAIASTKLHVRLPELAKDYDHVLIDGPPDVDALARSVILASDLVIMPVKPSPLDVWASASTVKLIEEAQQFRPELQAAFVINQKDNRTAIGRDVAKAFSSQPFPLLPVTVTQRIAFAERAASGLTVFDAPPIWQATREIKALVQSLDQQKRSKAA